MEGIRRGAAPGTDWHRPRQNRRTRPREGVWSSGRVGDMAKIYRAMLIDGEFPQVGGEPQKSLGVRVGDGANDDIPCDAEGSVHPNTGGMSVAPEVDHLPMHRVPKELRRRFPERFPDAVGPDRYACWWMGEGKFESGPVVVLLVLRPDPKRPTQHGFVEPDRKMPVAQYQGALAATIASWRRWEG